MNDTLSSLLNFQDTRTPMVDGHPKVETPKLQGANPNWTLNVQLPLNICPKLDASPKPPTSRTCRQQWQLHTGNRSSARWAVLVAAGGIQVDKLAAGLQESAFSAS